MSRATDETAEHWYLRAVDTYRAMQEAEQQHWTRLGFDRKLAPGEPYPLIDTAFHAAMEQAKAAELDLQEAAKAVARYRQA